MYIYIYIYIYIQCIYIYIIYMYQQGTLTQHTCDKTTSFISVDLSVPFWDDCSMFN